MKTNDVAQLGHEEMRERDVFGDVTNNQANEGLDEDAEDYTVIDRSQNAYDAKDVSEVVDHADITLEEDHSQSKKKATKEQADEVPNQEEDKNMRNMLLNFMADKTGGSKAVKKKKAILIDAHSTKNLNKVEEQ